MLGNSLKQSYFNSSAIWRVEASTVVFDGNGKLQVFISKILPLFCNVVVDSLVSFFHGCYMEIPF